LIDYIKRRLKLMENPPTYNLHRPVFLATFLSKVLLNQTDIQKD